MIAIIDYGLGNIAAFLNVYSKLNIPVTVAKNVDDLRNATRVILPGIGAFDHAIELLNKSGMKKTLDEIALKRRLPVLGICVGMQILASSSEEGKLTGLGWIDGQVKKLDTSTMSHRTHLPHMGWNDVRPIKESTIFGGIEQGGRFYFLHSYYFHCHKTENVLAVTDYGSQFASAVGCRNIFGVQFHPEKSHEWGIQLLKNFATV